MVKTIKNRLLRNQKADDLEIWYATSGARVLPNLFNDELWLILTYFMARSNLLSYAFVLGKGKTMDCSETIVVYDIKVGRCSKLNEYMNLYKYQRSRSFTDYGPRSLRFNIFKLLFLRHR